MMEATKPVEPPTRPAVMGVYKPDWMEQPSAGDMAWAYPPAAARKGLTGKAVIRCAVTPDGGLKDCKVAREEPADQGFGAAALKLAPGFRMIPPDDASDAAHTVMIPISFELPEPLLAPRPMNDAEAIAALVATVDRSGPLAMTAPLVGGGLAAVLLVVLYLTLGREPRPRQAGSVTPPR